jgi:carbonic anhydrase
VRKLIRGIIDFRRARRPDYAATFSRLAFGQSPDSLFVACSDSRVVPNLFASTEPGDLFVLRNVGNIVAPCGPEGLSLSDESEAAALEFAIDGLKVKDIIVCGHSGCGAMRSLLEPLPGADAPHFQAWLRHAARARDRYLAGERMKADLPPYDHVSQINVHVQIEHLRSYPVVRDAEASGRIALHAWWFDIAGADVLAWSAAHGRYVLIDEQYQT